MKAKHNERAMGVCEAGFARRRAKEQVVSLLLILLWLFFSALLLCLGDEHYTPALVVRVLLGEEVKGATYAVGTIRLPRVLVGSLAGFSFGVAGNVFQKMLRNSLASPDVMGITSGASAAAVFAMMVLDFSGMAVSGFAMAGGLAAAILILLVTRKPSFSVNKMILTGIGLQAMLQGVIQFVILKTSDYNIADALRWLSGSLNGVRMKDVTAFAPLVAACTLLILSQNRELQILGLGDELPVTLGLSTGRTRSLLLFSAVILCAGSTAVTGPLACVAFMAGPIAAGLLKTGGSGTLQAGFVGMNLVLFSEMVGQFATGTRYPVGVVTGIIGAPYLIWLLLRMNRKGA